MDHLQFKANQTAATYVSHGLDASSQEDFELHLMSCAECVDDVEAWRAIEKHMPREAHSSAHALIRNAGPQHWRLAASLVGVGLVGAVGGWYGRAIEDPPLDASTAFFNALPVTRGASECMALKFAPDTRRVVLRVAGVASDRRVVALDSQGRELAARGYAARRQSDGSWLLQFEAPALTRRAIRLESQDGPGPGEPLGCISAQVMPPE